MEDCPTHRLYELGLLRGAFNCLHPPRILLTIKAMRSFLKRLVGGRRSFRDLCMGKTAAPSVEENAEGKNSPVNRSLKKPAREPRNERKDLMALLRLNADHFMLGVMSHGSWSNKEPWLPKELKGFSD